MEKRCANVANCSTTFDTDRDPHVHVEGKYFCHGDCLDAYLRQADLFEFALKGAPLGRRPTKEVPWYAKDG